MQVTDEMVEAACMVIDKNNAYHNRPPISYVLMNIALEAALSTIKPMTANEIDSMMQRGCIDDTADLVEAVEYWHGIRE